MPMKGLDFILGAASIHNGTENHQRKSVGMEGLPTADKTIVQYTTHNETTYGNDNTRVNEDNHSCNHGLIVK